MQPPEITKKVSTFTPPPFVETCLPEKSPSITKRRFSHEQFLAPVPCNTTAADLDFVDTLVQGNFAEVVRVRRRDTGHVMIAKAFSHSSWRSEYLCSAEVRLLQSVNSPWILNFYGYIEDFYEDFILLEYLPLGNFYQLVSKAGNMSENQIKFYSGEMFLGVDALHENGFMHRNIQLTNYLVHGSGHLRISDFGLSYQFRKEETVPQKGKEKEKEKLPLITSPVFASAEKAVPGNRALTDGESSEKSGTGSGQYVLAENTTSYSAPEVLRLLMPKPYFRLLKRKVGYSYLCDYWSLGVAIYRMLYGRLPFIPDSNGSILDKVLDYRKTLTFPLDTKRIVPLNAVALVKDLLRRESQRLGYNKGFTEVKEHQFFADLNWGLLGHGVVSIPAKEDEVISFLDTDGLFSPNSTESSFPRKGSVGKELEQSESFDSAQSIAFRKALDINDLGIQLPLISDPTVPCMSNRENDGHGTNASGAKARTESSQPGKPPKEKRRRESEDGKRGRKKTSKHEEVQPGQSNDIRYRRSGGEAQSDKHATVREEEATFLTKMMQWFQGTSGSGILHSGEKTPSKPVLH